MLLRFPPPPKMMAMTVIASINNNSNNNETFIPFGIPVVYKILASLFNKNLLTYEYILHVIANQTQSMSGQSVHGQRMV